MKNIGTAPWQNKQDISFEFIFSVHPFKLQQATMRNATTERLLYFVTLNRLESTSPKGLTFVSDFGLTYVCQRTHKCSFVP